MFIVRYIVLTEECVTPQMSKAFKLLEEAKKFIEFLQDLNDELEANGDDEYYLGFTIWKEVQNSDSRSKL